MAVFGILIFAIWLGLPVIAIWQILSARRQFVQKTCPECDYDLTGASVGNPCPECGIIPAISRSKASNPERVVCRNCGHDLEGLQWDADCPECGLHSAAMPRFVPRQSAFRFRAILGSVLLAIWIGLTTIVVIDEFDSNRYNRLRATAVRVQQLSKQQAVQPQAAEQSETAVAEPAMEDRD